MSKRSPAKTTIYSYREWEIISAQVLNPHASQFKHLWLARHRQHPEIYRVGYFPTVGAAIRFVKTSRLRPT